MDEGRQATSTFHTVQYLGTLRCSLPIMDQEKLFLANYPDLQEVFENDYRATVLHYLYNGLMEGRDGYTIGGGHGKRMEGWIDGWTDQKVLIESHSMQLEMKLAI